jgi:SLOG family YspA-like protein
VLSSTKPPRLLICGARDWTDRFIVDMVLANYPPGTVVIHGAARGADTIAGELGKAMGFEVEPYPADWKKYGRAAGPIRNQQMLDEGKPTELVAFNNDLRHSNGTHDMLTRARRAGLPVAIYGSYSFSAEELKPPPLHRVWGES